MAVRLAPGASVPGIQPAEAEAFIAARNANDWDTDKIKDLINTYDNYVTLDPAGIFIVDLTLRSTVNLIAGTHLKATIMIDNNADIPFHVISHSW